MKTLAFLTFLLLSGSGNSQSNVIEFLSHSGNMKHFDKFSTRSIDGIETNFGKGVNPIVKNAVLDTIRVISECEVVMVTSEYCKDRYKRGIDMRKIRTQHEYEMTLAYGEQWSAGADTLLNHALFLKTHSLDSVKKVLKDTYHFRNPIETVVFIGYDNETIQAPEKVKSIEDVEVIEKEKLNENGFGLEILIAILLPLLGIYIFSPLAYKWAKN